MLFCIVLPVRQALAAAPAPGDIVVAGGGVVVSIDPRTGNQNLVSSNDKSLAAGGQALIGGWGLFGGIGREADGSLVVIDRRGDYDAPNSDPAHLIRINPATGAQSLIQGRNNQLTLSQLALVIGPRGEIYFSEESTRPGLVVFKADPATGDVSLVTSGDKSEAAGGANIQDSAMGLWADPDGTLWELAEHLGIVRIEPGSGKMTVFSSDAISTARGGAALYQDPRAMTRAPNGDFYVVDDPAIGTNILFGGSDARVIRIDHVSGAESLVTDNARSLRNGGKALMYRPYAIAIEADGNILITDTDAVRVIRINPTTGAQSLLGFSGLLDSPTGMLVVPGQRLPTATTLTVTTAGVAAGRVTSDVAGQIDCARAAQNNSGPPFTPRVTCTHDYGAGTLVTLTATPGPGGSFAGFAGGGCSGTGMTCRVQMDQARAVTATFTGRLLTVTPAGTGAGFITGFQTGIECGVHLDHQNICAVDFADGRDITLDGNSYPARNSFSGFSEDCSGRTCSVTMNSAVNVTAHFTGATPVRRTLTVSTTGAGAGYVHSSPAGIDCAGNLSGHTDCDESYVNGAKSLLTAHPLQGQRFTGFSGGGCSGTDPCSLTMNQSRAVTASFDRGGAPQRTLTIATAGSGSGFVDSAPAGMDCGLNAAAHGACSLAYDEGTRIVLAAHPSATTQFNGFSGAGCSGVATTCQVLMSQAQSVTANFATAALPSVSFSQATRTVAEGGNAVVDLVLSAASASRITLRLGLGGTAIAGNDYTAPAATVAFPAGVLSRRIKIPITDDAQKEGAETIILSINSATNAVIGSIRSFTATIRASD